MNSSYSTLAIVMYVPPTMIAVSIWNGAVDSRRGHGFDPAINVLANHVVLSMHCPGSSYHDALVVRLRRHRDSRLAVSHDGFHRRLMANTIHRMPLPAVEAVAAAAVPDWHANHVG